MDILKDAKLTNSKGETVLASVVLSKRIVILFFSANWSPPCRDFVPKLEAFYNELKVKRQAPLEVIFVSFDKNKNDMYDYMHELHGDWWAIDYDSTIRRYY